MMSMLPCLLSLALCAPPSQEPAVDGQLARGRLTELERAAGWRHLFDGTSSAGWVRHGTDAFPAQGWEIADGCLHLQPGAGGGDLVFAEPFGDFELEFEWRVAPGANSGVKYRVAPADSPRAMLGPEYQVLDDAAFPDEPPRHKAGALYALYEPVEAPPVKSGRFHRARIVARGERIEHWLDGRRVVACTVGDDDWNARKAASKFADLPRFAAPRAGHIGLQDHGGEVWYRDIRIRSWPPPGFMLPLIRSGTLDGWRSIGDAIYTAEGTEIVGRVGGGGQSFLVTERRFGDFIMEVELLTEQPGNSGIQVRSHQLPNGRVQGYQIEIDPSDRAWSGGLYDEARRGWLDDLAHKPAARAAFRRDDWNRYRIECIGPWIRAWVNGVPAADCFDPIDLEGFIGLQVHSGDNTRVRWRDPRVYELGTRAWERTQVSGSGPFCQADEGAGWTLAPTDGSESGWLHLAAPADFSLRLRFEREGAGLRVLFRAPRPPAAALESAGSRALAAGLSVGEQGLVFDLESALPARTEFPSSGTLVLTVHGRRFSAFLDGRRLLDLRDLPDDPAGSAFIAASGPASSRLQLAPPELLGPPR